MRTSRSSREPTFWRFVYNVEDVEKVTAQFAKVFCTVSNLCNGTEWSLLGSGVLMREGECGLNHERGSGIKLRSGRRGGR